MSIAKLFRKAGHLVIAVTVFHITSLPNHISYYVITFKCISTSELYYIK